MADELRNLSFSINTNNSYPDKVVFYLNEERYFDGALTTKWKMKRRHCTFQLVTMRKRMRTIGRPHSVLLVRFFKLTFYIIIAIILDYQFLEGRGCVVAAPKMASNDPWCSLLCVILSPCVWAEPGDFLLSIE